MISQENKNRDISDIQKQERTNGNQEQEQKRGDMPEKKERRECVGAASPHAHVTELLRNGAGGVYPKPGAHPTGNCDCAKLS